jgi:citrate lyase subunit alpha/citrate CoA-transferase
MVWLRQKQLHRKWKCRSRAAKLVTLEEAIRRSGLQGRHDLSFHHHFRAGDKVVNLGGRQISRNGL